MRARSLPDRPAAEDLAGSDLVKEHHPCWGYLRTLPHPLPLPAAVVGRRMMQPDLCSGCSVVSSHLRQKPAVVGR
jgi:hypothetical protein